MAKPTKWPVHPAKTQISLRIHAVWSAFAVPLWEANDPILLHVDREDSDQTGRMPKLIWVFAGRTGNFVGSVMLWIICCRCFDFHLEKSWRFSSSSILNWISCCWNNLNKVTSYFICIKLILSHIKKMSPEAPPGFVWDSGTRAFISGGKGDNGLNMKGRGEQRQFWGT